MTTVYLAPIDAEQSHDLDETIKLALEKTGVQKELDLCAYIPSRDGPLRPSTYLRLRDTEQETLCRLIKQHILDDDPHKVPIQSGGTHSEQSYSGMPLQECVRQAMAKLNVQKESALCRYIPYGEGYIHHFTYFKMKSANPVQARNLIQEYILDKRVSERVPHKPRKRCSHTKGNVYDTGRAANQHGSHASSGVEQLSSPCSPGTEKIAVTKTYKDERVDQLLQMLTQLAKTVGREKVGTVGSPERLSRESAISSIHVEECVQLLQQELIMKIIKKEADQNLWQLFTRLTRI